MSFHEIERIVGAKLPMSAHRHRPWWSNNPSNSVMTKEWLAAGYRTEQVDMAGKKLTFVKVAVPPLHGGGVAESTHPFHADAPKQKRHPIFGALKGTFTLSPGLDLTQPAMPEWADLSNEKYGRAGRV